MGPRGVSRAQDKDSLFLSVVTLAELRRGAAIAGRATNCQSSGGLGREVKKVTQMNANGRR
jgi:predicted nucleic acid-binding protein